MIIVHELPFSFTEYEVFNLLKHAASPYFERISRATAKRDCVTQFEAQKKKLMQELKSIKRVSLTTDLWKSDHNISYMVVTCHYVDSKWNLQKRTLNFCGIPPPHTGLVISDVMQKCIVEWGIENKLWTVTVDNAKHNDKAVGNLMDNLSYNRHLPLGGKIFHVRCCAHILNLLVQEGLSAIQGTITKVRDSVKYVSASEAHLNMFKEIAKQLQLSSKKLVMDCCTRWNATYFMLSSALEFKDVFPRYQQRDASYTMLLTEEEWEKVRIVCNFLEDFKDITENISGSEYPASNLFMPHLIEIKKTIEIVNEDSVAGLELQTTVRHALYNLFNEYVEEYKSTHNVGNASAQNKSLGTAKTLKSKGKRRPRDYDCYMQTVDCVDEVKSDLDLYLEEGVVV